jgi:cerevisin
LKALDDGGSGYSSSIINALNVVKQRHLAKPNAKSVVSMSLAGYCGSECVNDPVNQAISSLHAVGILVTVAAGNNGGDACFLFPASASDAITVAASDQFDSLAGFSNVGTCVDIIGPGSAVNSACAKGSGSLSCPDEVSYKILSGTSMSTPHVTGTLALLLEKHLGSFNSSADVVKSALFCDAVQDKIEGVPVETTANLLVQVPQDDNTFNRCLPTAESSTSPTALPTASLQPVVPSMAPTGPSKMPSTKQPSVAPSFKPTLAPTACLLM